MQSLAGCLEGRFYGGKNIRRFYLGSLGDYFAEIQDSFTTRGLARHILGRDSLRMNRQPRRTEIRWRPEADALRGMS